ncbi:CAunnamed protein product [Biomphalaria glabrata]|nr:CAunnamed protein product [Biomphalaria glabrata]
MEKKLYNFRENKGKLQVTSNVTSTKRKLNSSPPQTFDQKKMKVQNVGSVPFISQLSQKEKKDTLSPNSSNVSLPVSQVKEMTSNVTANAAKCVSEKPLVSNINVDIGKRKKKHAKRSLAAGKAIENISTQKPLETKDNNKGCGSNGQVATVSKDAEKKRAPCTVTLHPVQDTSKSGVQTVKDQAKPNCVNPNTPYNSKIDSKGACFKKKNCVVKPLCEAKEVQPQSFKTGTAYAKSDLTTNIKNARNQDRSHPYRSNVKTNNIPTVPSVNIHDANNSNISRHRNNKSSGPAESTGSLSASSKQSDTQSSRVAVSFRNYPPDKTNKQKTTQASNQNGQQTTSDNSRKTSEVIVVEPDIIEIMDVDEVILLSSLQELRNQTSHMLNQLGQSIQEAPRKVDSPHIDTKGVDNKDVEVNGNVLQKSKSAFVVVDTNVLITNLSLLKQLLNKHIPGFGKPIILLPWAVMQELDYLKKRKGFSVNSSENSNASTSVRAIDAVKFIHNHLMAKNPQLIGQTAFQAYEPTDFQVESNDDRILQCYLQVQKKEKESHVVLVTRDINLMNKAVIMGITVSDTQSLCSHLDALSVPNNDNQTLTQGDRLFAVIGTGQKSTTVCSQISTPSRNISADRARQDQGPSTEKKTNAFTHQQNSKTSPENIFSLGIFTHPNATPTSQNSFSFSVFPQCATTDRENIFKTSTFTHQSPTPTREDTSKPSMFTHKNTPATETTFKRSIFTQQKTPSADNTFKPSIFTQQSTPAADTAFKSSIFTQQSTPAADTAFKSSQFTQQSTPAADTAFKSSLFTQQSTPAADTAFKSSILTQQSTPNVNTSFKPNIFTQQNVPATNTMFKPGIFEHQNFSPQTDNNGNRCHIPQFPSSTTDNHFTADIFSQCQNVASSVRPNISHHYSTSSIETSIKPQISAHQTVPSATRINPSAATRVETNQQTKSNLNLSAHPEKTVVCKAAQGDDDVVLAKFESVWKAIFNVLAQVSSILSQGPSHRDFTAACEMCGRLGAVLPVLKEQFDRCLSFSPVIVGDHILEFRSFSDILNSFYHDAKLSCEDPCEPVTFQQLMQHFKLGKNRSKLSAGVEQLQSFIHENEQLKVNVCSRI